MWNQSGFWDLFYVGSDPSCSIRKCTHASDVSYERMYSTGSGTFANVSTVIVVCSVLKANKLNSLRLNKCQSCTSCIPWQVLRLFRLLPQASCRCLICSQVFDSDRSRGEKHKLSPHLNFLDNFYKVTTVLFQLNWYQPLKAWDFRTYCLTFWQSQLIWPDSLRWLHLWQIVVKFSFAPTNGKQNLAKRGLHHKISEEELICTMSTS